jgi:hypothetical protein
MVFLKNNAMRTGQKIRTELIRLSAGGRLLRLTEPGTGLTLERALDSKQPVVWQKQQLLHMFNVALQAASPAQLYKSVFGKTTAKSPVREARVAPGVRQKRYATRKPANTRENLQLAKG